MSRFDDLVTDIATAFDDATVSFEAGALRLNRHGQQRKIVFVRQRGTLNFESVSNARPESAAVAGVGTFTRQVFTRNEVVEVTLRAEDEEALDTLFDRFVNVTHDLYGPSAFRGSNNYGWFDEDSTSSRTYKTRNPAIRLLMTFSLASRSDPGSYIVVADTTADLGIPDETKADAPTVVNP